MAFIHGRKSFVYANGIAMHPYFRSAQLQRTCDMAETSKFQTDDKTYQPGMLDGTINFEGMFEGTAEAVDEQLEAILGSETKNIVSVIIGDGSHGTAAHSLLADESTYDVTTATDDIAAITAEFQSSSSIDRAVIHKALTAITTANDGNGTAVDDAAASDYGGVAYLHVTAASGSPTLTVKVQHSDDNAVWVDLITFDPVTAVGAQRESVTGTVERYTRSQDAIDQGSATYVMAFGRYTFEH